MAMETALNQISDSDVVPQMALSAATRLRGLGVKLLGEHVVNIGSGDGKSMQDPCYPFYADLELPGACFDASGHPAIHKNLPWERVVKRMGEPFTPPMAAYLLKECGIPKRGHFLKIDIDGYDAQVLRRILELGYRFDIIQIEVNPDFPPPVHFSVLYHPMYQAGGRGGFYGASAQYVADLGRVWGYVPITLDMHAPSHDILLVHARHVQHFAPEPLEEMFAAAGNGASHFLYNLGIDCSGWKTSKDYDRLVCEMWSVVAHASRMKHGDVLPFVLNLPVQAL